MSCELPGEMHACFTFTTHQCIFVHVCIFSFVKNMNSFRSLMSSVCSFLFTNLCYSLNKGSFVS